MTKVMIKTIFISVGLFFMSCSNTVREVAEPISQVERSESSRRHWSSVVVNKETTLVIIKNDTVKLKTSPKQWAKITTVVNKINLSELANLKVPQDARQHEFDGAPIVSLSLQDNKGGEVYYSPSYDASKAPAMIYELDSLLSSLVSE